MQQRKKTTFAWKHEFSFSYFVVLFHSYKYVQYVRR